MTDQKNPNDPDRTMRMERPPAAPPPPGASRHDRRARPTVGLGGKPSFFIRLRRFFFRKKRRDVAGVMEQLREKRPDGPVVFSGVEEQFTDLSDNYNQQAAFAEGGQGVIHRGFDRKLQRLVAIKSLRKELAGTPEQRSRFLTEARLTAQLDHPAVVPIYALNSDPENGLHLAMKLINGETFKAYLEQIRTHYKLDGVAAFDENKALRDRLDIILKACDAIEYAHSRNVMHCDLKPSNIMIGQYRETYIMDWGIARKIDGEAERSNPQAPEPLCGTVQYLAPETIRGERPDRRADIFAMGVILFEAVTLKSAFTGTDVAAVLSNIRSGRMEEVEHLFRSPIDADLRAIIRKATANFPAERYQQIGDLSGDLRRYLTGLEVSARPDSYLMRAVRWWYRRRRLMLLVTLCGLVIGAGALSFALHREYRFSERQRQRDHALALALSFTSAAGYQLNEQFAKVEWMTDALAADVQFLLQYDLHADNSETDRIHKYYSVRELRSTPSPSMQYSEFHRGLIDINAIVFNTAPDTERKQIRDRLETIGRFIPRLLQTILESPLHARLTSSGLDEMKNRAFRDGTPIIRVIFGFSDGLFVAYPAGNTFPELYDPRIRLWYKAASSVRMRRAVWIPPYLDSIPDFGLVLSCSVPLHLLGTRGGGVCAMDLSLTELVKELRTTGNNGNYVLEKAIVDNSGEMIVSTTRNFADARMRHVKGVAGELEPEKLEDPSILREMKARRIGVLSRNTDEGEIIYVFCHIRSVDWYYIEKLDLKRLLEREEKQRGGKS